MSRQKSSRSEYVVTCICMLVLVSTLHVILSLSNSPRVDLAYTHTIDQYAQASATDAVLSSSPCIDGSYSKYPMLSPVDTVLAPYLKDEYMHSHTGWKRYRLGDMFQHTRFRERGSGYKYHKANFPNSIATEYMQRSSSPNNYTLLLCIINQRWRAVMAASTNFSKPSNQTLVVHVRLGDVIDLQDKYTVQDFLHRDLEKRSTQYIFPLTYYAQVLSEIDRRSIKVNEILIVTGFIVEGNHLRSFQYLNELIKCLRVHSNVESIRLRLNENPDEDVVVMANSQYFVAGGGGFGDLIARIVEMKGGIVLTNTSHSQ